MSAAICFGVLACSWGALAQDTDPCEVPSALIASDGNLNRVESLVRDNRRLDIAVFGTGSSTLPGPDGENLAYPARLEAALRRRLPGISVNVTAQIQRGKTTAEMAPTIKKLVSEQKPALIIWQTGTVEFIRGVDPDSFLQSLEDGIEQVQLNGADVVLMNMQYSPRTEAMIAVDAYEENMRLAARERNVPLFNRLALMRYWSDVGTFDLFAATKGLGIAQKVHNCIGRALAAQLIDTAKLGEFETKKTQ